MLEVPRSCQGLDVQRWLAAGGQQRCLTAAAFVPSSMMASGSESDGESGDGNGSSPPGDPA